MQEEENIASLVNLIKKTLETEITNLFKNNTPENIKIFYDKYKFPVDKILNTNYNNPIIQNICGTFHSLGLNTPKDESKAFRYYESAAQKGYYIAQYNTGNNYKNKGEHKTALEWFKLSAKQNYPRAQNFIGEYYYFGWGGLEKNYNTAFNWYNRVALANCEDGFYSLAFCYFHGIGTEQDYAKALEWFYRSAESGETGSMYYIEKCYRNGYGVLKDDKIADEWYIKSTMIPV